MSLSTINTSTTPASTASRTESIATGVAATLAGVAEAASDGVSATVSFSGKALHALEHAGAAAVDEVENLAVGAWHAVESGAQALEHAGEAVADAVVVGAHEVVSTATTVGKALVHYAEVGLSATGDAVSELASGGVMAASAGGKAIVALI